MNASRALVGYTQTQLECISKEIFRRRPEIACSPPIRLEFLIENTPNVQLEIVMGLLANHKVEGGIWKESMTKQLTVFVDWGIYMGSWAGYNAVLGEEFAHLSIHPALLLQVDSVEAFLKLQLDPEWERYERDARRFSRALRMPAAPFIAHAEEIYQQVALDNDFGDADRIDKLVRNGLSQAFRVPPEDAQRRMLDPLCQLTNRIRLSVQACEGTLVPPEWSVSVSPPSRQPLLEGFDLD